MSCSRPGDGCDPAIPIKEFQEPPGNHTCPLDEHLMSRLLVACASLSCFAVQEREQLESGGKEKRKKRRNKKEIKRVPC